MYVYSLSVYACIYILFLMMYFLFTDSLRGSSVQIGTIQRRLAWPLRKYTHIYLYIYIYICIYILYAYRHTITPLPGVETGALQGALRIVSNLLLHLLLFFLLDWVNGSFAIFGTLL